MEIKYRMNNTVKGDNNTWVRFRKGNAENKQKAHYFKKAHRNTSKNQKGYLYYFLKDVATLFNSYHFSGAKNFVKID